MMVARTRKHKQFYVYCVYDGATPIYVGKGCGHRIRESARKHGGDARVLEYVTDETEAFNRERYWIKELSPTENKSPGGNGGRAGAIRLVPRGMLGLVTEAQMRKGLKEIKDVERDMERVGPKKYVAEMLLGYDLSRFVSQSKLEIIRQVANGPGC
jgi:hypothetical protein